MLTNHSFSYNSSNSITSQTSLLFLFCFIIKKMRRFFIFNPWIIVAFIVVLPVLLSLNNPRVEPEPENTITQTTSSSFSYTSFRSVILANTFPFDFNQRIRDGSNLQYNFYRDSCPQAEDIVRSAVTDIYFDHRDLAPSLLRLFFHDCFIQVYLIFFHCSLILYFLWKCCVFVKHFLLFPNFTGSMK